MHRSTREGIGGPGLMVLVAVVFVALNQRPALVGLAPVLDELRAATGLSSTMAGLLTALPVLCFGAFAPVAPRLARRVGLETAVAVSLLLLTAGIALRLLTPTAALFGGTVVAGASIALANVLVPAYVKSKFPRPGLAMGLYSASLSGGAALAAGLTVPIASGLGVNWRVAISTWGVLAVAALIVWVVVTGAGWRSRVGTTAVAGSWGLLRQPLARQVTVYLGLQSVQFYAMTAWLPTLLIDQGLPPARGGLLLAVSTVAGAAAALVVPSVADRLHTSGRGQQVLIGVAQGGGFALSLTLIVLRTRTPLMSARLGGVAQCLGYLLAGLGPLTLGALHDQSRGWQWPLVFLLVVVAPTTWAGWGAARRRELTESAPST